MNTLNAHDALYVFEVRQQTTVAELRAELTRKGFRLAPAVDPSRISFIDGEVRQRLSEAATRPDLAESFIVLAGTYVLIEPD